MYNAYLTNDFANARLRGSTFTITQNGSPYSVSNANIDAMFDGTASFWNISPTSGFTFPLVIEFTLPRTLTYGTWVGIGFGNSGWRANSVKIEVYSTNSSSWVTMLDTTTNTSEDVFVAVTGLTGGNSTGITSIRYTLANPNSTQLRIAHIWGYNFASDMWSTTMMPRAGGAFYGPVTSTTIDPASVPFIVKGAASQSTDLLRAQNSSSTTLFKIDQNGFIVAGGATVLSNAVISSSIYGTTQVGIAVRGTAGQTADLQQWQTSTPTTVARVDSGGNFKANNVATLNSIAQMAESNSGALFVMGRATAQASSPGLNFGTLYFRDGTTAGTLRLATRTGASGVEETIVDNLSSTGSTAGARFTGAGGVVTTGTLSSTGLLLTGTASPITLNGSVGTSGQVLTSAGAGATPTWTTVSGGSFTGGTLTSNLTLAAGTTSLSPLTFQSGTNLTTVTAGANEYDGTVFYQTSNTNPGRALATQEYYYASSADWLPDFSTSSATQSFLGTSTRGIVVAAGTTYEYEFYTTVRHQYVSTTGISGAYDIYFSTQSGTPTTSVVHQVEYGSNTTGFTTATSMSLVRPTTSVTFMAAISSGSRYAFLRARGIIRVTGTGTTKIYPGLNPTNIVGDNIWTVQAGTVFKLKPLGNGTVTTVGTWTA